MFIAGHGYSESFDDEQSAEVHTICDEPVSLVMYSSRRLKHDTFAGKTACNTVKEIMQSIIYSGANQISEYYIINLIVR